MKYITSALTFIFLTILFTASASAASYCAAGGMCTDSNNKLFAQTDKKNPTPVPLKTLKAEREQKIVYTIYYFHGNKRCATCKRIEAQTKALAESAFANKIKDGTLTFVSVNTDEEQNKHFIKDFNLVSSGVEIARTNTNGITDKHRALPTVWPLAYREQDFNNYLTNEINAFLAEIL